jgi:hypothetical protein
MATIRDMVRAIQTEMLTTDISPHRAAALDNKLSALLYNCAAEIREADMAYAQVYLACMQEEKAANRARVKSEVTPEYARKCEARDTRELVKQMLSSCRNLCRVETEAMRLAR